MTTRTHREFLKVQQLESQRMAELASGHPLMSVAFAERQRELQEKIDSIPLGSKEPRAVLFFSGAPVSGSQGIDAVFASNVIEPFQKMVQADYSNRWGVRDGRRGKRLTASNSRLMLTGLPRGSFGLELSRADNEDLYANDEVADTLSHVTQLIKASAESDEDFAAELDEASPRVVQNLKQFLNVIAQGNAGLRLESGDFRCEMSPSQAMLAYGRVAETQTDEQSLRVYGTLNGVLLDSWMFNFVSDDGDRIAGKIDQDLTEEDVVRFDREFFRQRCVATLTKTTVVFKNGRQRTSYQLANLESLDGTEAIGTVGLIPYKPE